MLEVVSVSGFSDFSEDQLQPVSRPAVSARRGGLVHGTKVATTSGWKPVESLTTGDLVRTLDNGFQEVRRTVRERIAVTDGETRPEHLPVLVPSRTAFNGRPVWLMPEQGMAIDQSKLDPAVSDIAVVPARALSGMGAVTSQAPARMFDVTSLIFDHDEVAFIEGGLQAYCSAGRLRPVRKASQRAYHVVNEDQADILVDTIAIRGDMSALANALGALPAPIPQEPVFPIRPPRGMRRPGRPGRPGVPALFLRPEWQT